MNSVVTGERLPMPWYKEVWAWFVLTPLIVVVIACMITGTIAFTNQDDIVVDNYYQEGRMINQRFEQDEHAAALGLQGELRFDRQVGEVVLTLSSHEPLPAHLVLGLDSPALANQDLELTLAEISPGHYRGDLPHSIAHRWYIRILPETETQIAEAPWRLKAEIDFDHAESVRFNLDE